MNPKLSARITPAVLPFAFARFPSATTPSLPPIPSASAAVPPFSHVTSLAELTSISITFSLSTTGLETATVKLSTYTVALLLGRI